MHGFYSAFASLLVLAPVADHFGFLSFHFCILAFSYESSLEVPMQGEKTTRILDLDDCHPLAC